MWTRSAVVLLSLCAWGCGGNAEASSGTAADASVTESGLGDSPIGNDSDVGQPMCYSDFPCHQGETIWCTDQTHYTEVTTHDCHFMCGPGPCQGGSCNPVGDEQACPAGQVCIQGAGYGDFDHCGNPDAGTDAQPDAAQGPCGDGFCRPAVMSSCGDPGFYEMPMWDCTTSEVNQGYCCLPKAGCVSGYCTTTSFCKPPLMLTQVGCDVDGGAGSCCVEPK